ncbi:hypothetical protein [Streptomyces paromomycinus]|uniref:Uncharacterized protein n=1 Tax=Streptomyces paromomycinus TaxID=92743 RepID=A0A401WGD4_STREY|nr:hypothetical protein [Streptomyces paromomycinus]GCD48376.1 hypothetical protein GKJPGBOP_08173 [Streptomyces paromomycinus]
MLSPTVIVGLHGFLTPFPWFDRVVERDDEGAGGAEDAEGSVEEDVLGSVVDRAGAYGWQTVSSWLTEDGRTTAAHEPTAWAHEEVGGDWTQDGRIHQLGWLQAGVLTDSPRPGLPLRPIVLVLTEALTRVGAMTFTGVHAVLPLAAVERNTAFQQAELAPWFGLADPDARHEVVVTVSCRTGTGGAGHGGLGMGDAEAVCEAVREMAQETVGFSVSVDSPGSGGRNRGALLERPGLDLDLDAGVHTVGMREVLRWDCRTREWSPDIAVWLVEMVVEGLRRSGRSVPVAVTASLATPVSPGYGS